MLSMTTRTLEVKMVLCCSSSGLRYKPRRVTDVHSPIFYFPWQMAIQMTKGMGIRWQNLLWTQNSAYNCITVWMHPISKNHWDWLRFLTDLSASFTPNTTFRFLRIHLMITPQPHQPPTDLSGVYYSAGKKEKTLEDTMVSSKHRPH